MGGQVALRPRYPPECDVVRGQDLEEVIPMTLFEWLVEALSNYAIAW